MEHRVNAFQCVVLRNGGGRIRTRDRAIMSRTVETCNAGERIDLPKPEKGGAAHSAATGIKKAKQPDPAKGQDQTRQQAGPGQQDRPEAAADPEQGGQLAAALAMIDRLPLSDQEKAQAIRRLLAGE